MRQRLSAARRAWRSYWERPRPRRFAVITCATIVIVTAAGAILRVIAHDRALPLVYFNSFTPYVYWPAFFAGGFLADLGHRWGIPAALALVAAFIVFTWPDLSASHDPPDWTDDSPHLRVATGNLFNENPDPEAYLREVIDWGPDVVVFQEWTTEASAAAEAAGLHDALPYSAEEPRIDTQGSAIFSRLPLSELEFGLEPARVSAVVDFEGQEVRVLGIHPLPAGYPGSVGRWSGDFERVIDIVDADPRPFILAGDFNATQHSRWHRALVHGRLADAHRQCDRGFAVTWPANRFPFPPIRIDHVLISEEMHCMEIHEGEGPGSDHEPVFVDLAFRDDVGALP